MFFFQANAQLEKEISSYVDSTEIFVNNGRQLLLEEIQSFNYPKAKEIFQLLNEKTKRKKCAPFTYNEEMYISLLVSDWGTFFDNAIDFKEKASEQMCYQPKSNIAKGLYEEFVQNLGVIKSNFSKEKYYGEEKDVFDIYMYLIETGKQDSKYDQEYKSFKKKYPKSKYKDFFDSYLPAPSYPASMTFSMGALSVFPMSKLQQNFKSNVGFSMSMDYDINKVYVSLYLQTSSFTLQTPFEVSSNGLDYTFYQGDKFTYLDGGLQGGYYVLRNNRFHIAPYITFGGTNLQSNLFQDSSDDKYEYNVFNTVNLGLGINTEFKIVDFNLKDSQFSYSYISLKLNGGYNMPVKYNYTPFKGNISYAALTLCWGIGKF